MFSIDPALEGISFMRGVKDKYESGCGVKWNDLFFPDVALQTVNLDGASHGEGAESSTCILKPSAREIDLEGTSSMSSTGVRNQDPGEKLVPRRDVPPPNLFSTVRISNSNHKGPLRATWLALRVVSRRIMDRRRHKSPRKTWRASNMCVKLGVAHRIDSVAYSEAVVGFGGKVR